VPRVRGLHPEFGFIGTPSFLRRSFLWRRSGFFVLVICGLVGDSSFKTGHELDPTQAMAFVPAEALSSTARFTPAAMTESNSGGSEVSQAGAVQSRCTGHPVGDCPVSQTRRPRSTRALNERPVIAAIPIGHRNDPAVIPPEPRAPVVAALSEDIDTAAPVETPLAKQPSRASLPAESPPAERHRERAQQRDSDRAQRRETDRAQRHEAGHAQRHGGEHRKYASALRHYSVRVDRGRAYAGLWWPGWFQ
jgi:hypothetical protein